ncbi:MAG: amidase, partial [Pseudomonadota bacterium]
MTHHEFDDRLDHLIWGHMGSSIPPAMTVASGDTITIDALPAGPKERLPSDRIGVLPSHLALVESR